MENRLKFTLWQQLICAKALYVNSNLAGPINNGFWNQGSPDLEDRADCKGWLRALLLAVLKVMLEGLIYDNKGEKLTMYIFFGSLVIAGCPCSVNGPTCMCIQTTPIRFCGLLNLKNTKK